MNRYRMEQNYWYRFWKKIDVRGDDECWPWTGCLSFGGYGMNSRSVLGLSTTSISTRIMWSFLMGTLPRGIQVCHTCDNPKCMNPSHHFFGSNKDNANDKVLKGRARPPVFSLTLKDYKSDFITLRRAVLELGAPAGMHQDIWNEALRMSMGKKIRNTSPNQIRLLARLAWERVSIT